MWLKIWCPKVTLRDGITMYHAVEAKKAQIAFLFSAFTGLHVNLWPSFFNLIWLKYSAEGRKGFCKKKHQQKWFIVVLISLPNLDTRPQRPVTEIELAFSLCTSWGQNLAWFFFSKLETHLQIILSVTTYKIHTILAPLSRAVIPKVCSADK